MFLFLINLCYSAGITQHEERSFLAWMRSTNQFYTGEEYHFRLGIFLSNLRYIREFNSAKKTFRLGLNKLICYTPAEYQSLIGSVVSLPKPTQSKESAKIVKKPDSFDWRDKGLVNPIRDQGSCSAGYVFAMTQACEFRYGNTHSFLPYFSDQNLLDCSTESEGCLGGTLEDVISRIVHYQQGYLMFSDDYPYVGCKREKCYFDFDKAIYVTINFMVGNYPDEERVADFVSKGVCAAMIDASQASFQL